MARSPDERQTRRRREFRVSNESPTSTLTNVKAGAAMRRLGVVPTRSLRTMSGAFMAAGGGIKEQIRREAAVRGRAALR